MIATGRSVREGCARSDLAELAQRPSSYDPVARLRWQNVGRIEELLPLRYERMLASPFAFYRGAALLMAEDLARGPSPGIHVQICGDAHLRNFGIFSSPERQLVFDVNDFDETAQGPFEWDVKRLVTSFAIVAREKKITSKQEQRMLLDIARVYQESIRRFARMTRLEVWYAALDIEGGVDGLRGFFNDLARQRIDDVIGRAKGKDDRRAFAELVESTTEGPRFKTTSPRTVAFRDLAHGSLFERELIYRVLEGYPSTLSTDRRRLLSQFHYVDAARHVMGVGSVGTGCYIVLMVGRDDEDPLVLQLKQARPSVVSIARGVSDDQEPADRVVKGQRLMQATHDVFLGWHGVRQHRDQSYYVRQLYDHKAAIDVARLDEKGLRAYGRLCAWVLARAHARSGTSGEIAGYLGRNDDFAQAVAGFALSYRKRNHADYLALHEASSKGRLSNLKSRS